MTPTMERALQRLERRFEFEAEYIVPFDTSDLNTLKAYWRADAARGVRIVSKRPLTAREVVELVLTRVEEKPATVPAVPHLNEIVVLGLVAMHLSEVVKQATERGYLPASIGGRTSESESLRDKKLKCSTRPPPRP